MGRWARYVFNLVAATSCLVLGLASALLLILALIELKMKWYIVFIYIVFLLFWTNGSFSLQTQHDETYSPSGVQGVLGGTAMGCFGGFFVAAL